MPASSALLEGNEAKGYASVSGTSTPVEVAASGSQYGMFPKGLSSSSLQNLWKGLRGGGGDSGELDWLSLIVVYWVTLTSEAARGLVLPSQWPFLKELGGSKSFLGVLVASFSFGRMISTVPLGYFSDTSMRAVMVLCSFVQILGNLIYSLSPNSWVLLCARIVVGFGSATMSVSRSHVTRSLRKEQRTYHFAYLSALQFVGFAVLPGLGGLLAALPEFGEGTFSLNEYRYPGYLLIIANVLAIALLLTVYHDPPRGAPARPKNNSANSGPVFSFRWPFISFPQAPESTMESQREWPSADFLALTACLVINVAFRGVVAQLETVVAPFLMERFSLTMPQASYYIALLGFVGLLVYVSFRPIALWFSDRTLVMSGLVVAVFATFCFSVFHSMMSFGVWVFVLGLIWSISYPVGQTAILGLFSKLLANLPAGSFLGIFSAAGSLARLFFASLAGVTWNVFGRGAVFMEMFVYMSLTLGLMLISYKRLDTGRSL